MLKWFFLAFILASSFSKISSQVSWGRHCEQDSPIPRIGYLKGEIPSWLEGSLTQVGPGLQYFGATAYKHVFDGLAVLHRMTVSNGTAFYMSRYLDSQTYRENRRANRIVVSEFGTAAYLSPKDNYFSQVLKWLTPVTKQESTDNCVINVLQTGEEMVAMTETDRVNILNPETLETIEWMKISNFLPIHHISAHPHIARDGTVYNVALSAAGKKPNYIFLASPKGNLRHTKIISSIPARWQFFPSYFHSFALTEHYLLLVELPLVIDTVRTILNGWLGKPFIDSIVWYPNLNTIFRIIEKNSGKELRTKFVAPPFMLFHHINAFESGDYIIVDLCASDSGELIYDYNIVNTLKNGSDSTKQKTHTEVRRFVIPVKDVRRAAAGEELLTNVPEARLYRLTGPTAVSASAIKMENEEVHLRPLMISPIFFEMPKINYQYNGLRYRYCYGVGTLGRDLEFATIIKIDVYTGEEKVWVDTNYTVSEPMFVANPDDTSEDDGVLLSIILHKEEPRNVALLILDAKKLNEMGRIHFIADGTVTPLFHGQFAKN